MHSTACPVSFCTVSPSRNKGPPAIWKHLSPVLDYIQSTHPEVSTIHFYSDGPCTQYKQQGNLFLFCTELFRRGFTAGTWNFFEASHGKGAPDGVGGALKRRADCLVSKGTDIPDAAALFFCVAKDRHNNQVIFCQRRRSWKSSCRDANWRVPSSIYYEDPSGSDHSPWRTGIQGCQLLVHSDTKSEL